MRFIADENIPGLLIRRLADFGHDIIACPKSRSDTAIAKLALSQKRTILTLDKDFTNTILFPPRQFNIIHIAIYPPEKNAVTQAVLRLIAGTKVSNLKGLIIVTQHDFIRYFK